MTTDDPIKRTASDLMRLHHELQSSYQMERWLDLFADDAVVEFPYAASIGLPPRFAGKQAIWAYFRGVPDLFLDLKFDAVRVFAAGQATAVAEVHGSATIAPTGLLYVQDWIMVLHASDGKIVHYREYWNPVPAMKAFGNTFASLTTPKEGA